MKVTLIDKAPSGDCPLCGEVAYPYTVTGLAGYFDSCHKHRGTIAVDALADQAERKSVEVDES